VTHSPLSKPDATQGVGQSDTGFDSSLTDFLSPPQADDELGRLGKYRILKILGHGGMGVIYKAEDTTLKRNVAIKAMLPALAVSARADNRFLGEAQAMAAVAHDHIVRIYEVNEDRGVPFLAMEFLKGESLDERLHREPLLPLAEVLRIGQEIAEALGAAHEHGLIHRDIKPANIWLEAPRNRVKLLDFGLARATSRDAGLTQQGAIVGTPAYMAPEQAMGDTADGRCDLFSLGVVLYRLCSGQLPFQGKNALSTLVAVAMKEPLPPTRINSEVPRALSDLVLQLLEKDPEHRPASAGEVVAELQDLEKSLDGTSVTDTPRARRAPESVTFDFGVETEKAPRGRSEAQKRPRVAASRVRPARKHSSKSLLPLVRGGVSLLAVVIVGLVVFRNRPEPGTSAGESPVSSP
jgi:serine/threonine protein kinase